MLLEDIMTAKTKEIRMKYVIMAGLALQDALLYWRFSEKPATSLPFSYGVLTNRSTPLPTPYISNYIYIDDENKSNGNEAILWQHRVLRGGSSNTTTRNLNDNERYRGIQAGANTGYEIG